MRKFFLLGVFASLFMGSSARAQLPLPHQSMPICIFTGTTKGVHFDGTIDWGFQIEHYGRPVNGSTYYDTWIDETLYKLRPDGSWSPVNTDISGEQLFSNKSANTPNLTANLVNDHVVKLTYGPGTYTYTCDVYAWSAATGVKIFMWSQSVGFTTQP